MCVSEHHQTLEGVVQCVGFSLVLVECSPPLSHVQLPSNLQ